MAKRAATKKRARRAKSTAVTRTRAAAPALGAPRALGALAFTELRVGLMQPAEFALDQR